MPHPPSSPSDVGHIDCSKNDYLPLNGSVNQSPARADQIEELDVLVTGAGFAGIYLLYKLRKENFNVKIVEIGSDLGGVWYWNRYPGARADTQYPLYAYSLPEVYEDWAYETDYPNSAELRRYFAHVEKKLHIKKDTFFHTKVISAEFDDTTNKWTVKCDTGRVFRTSFVVTSIGFAAKRYIPDWEGLDSFKGVIYHSSFWPKEGVDVRGKRCAVLGSGSTGVQITQEWAKEISDQGDLKMFQRTPNLCCPMKPVVLTPEQQARDKVSFPELYRKRQTTFGGFGYQFQEKRMLDATPEERQAMFEKLWDLVGTRPSGRRRIFQLIRTTWNFLFKGGFHFLMNNYYDMTRDLVANRYAYDFWRSKVLPRIKDHETANLLAPVEQPHPFGGKRLALEDGLYEEFNRPNVHVVDIKSNAITHLEPDGIVTADRTLHKVDVIAVVTGFDGITGGMKDIAIRGRLGKLLCNKWAKGTRTYLGIATAGFPNLFFTLGPQAPSAFSNGPACAELQGDWIVHTFKHMRDNRLQTIDARASAEEDWKKLVHELSAKSLRHATASWYNGANVPRKVVEPLNFAGGLPLYTSSLETESEGGYKGFVLN
jgi:cation diffusion facilitator CzcD-associated flavoprotein CzcO